MITRLIWTIWTPMSSVPKKADKLNLSLFLHNDEIVNPVGGLLSTSYDILWLKLTQLLIQWLPQTMRYSLGRFYLAIRILYEGYVIISWIISMSLKCDCVFILQNITCDGLSLLLDTVSMDATLCPFFTMPSSLHALSPSIGTGPKPILTFAIPACSTCAPPNDFRITPVSMRLGLSGILLHVLIGIELDSTPVSIFILIFDPATSKASNHVRSVGSKLPTLIHLTGPMKNSSVSSLSPCGAVSTVWTFLFLGAWHVTAKWLGPLHRWHVLPYAGQSVYHRPMLTTTTCTRLRISRIATLRNTRQVVFVCDDDCCGFGATGCDFTWCIAHAVAVLGACADFIVCNSCWAISDALHISMVFVRSKSFSRNKRSYNATDCVSNTILSLNILSFSLKSHPLAICFKTDR